jgi:hypothetical protein
MKLFTLALVLLSFSAFAVEIKVPAAEILVAARTIVAQSGPAYTSAGTITCKVISTGWSPTTSSCEIKVKGKTAKLNNPSEVIDVVSKVKVPTGPFYNFSGRFKATSLSSEVPPYGVKETAVFTLKK